MLGWSHFQLSWFCSTKTIVCLVSEEFELGHALFAHNWENTVFIPSRSLVTETSARSVLIGDNFIECCFWKTLNLTHKGTHPSQPWSQIQARGRRKYFGLTTGDWVPPFLPLANIHIRRDVAFLPSHVAQRSSVSVSQSKQLFCAFISLPGLDYTPAGWNSKSSHCYLETGLGIYGGSGRVARGWEWHGKKTHMATCSVWECKVLRLLL